MIHQGQMDEFGPCGNVLMVKLTKTSTSWNEKDKTFIHPDVIYYVLWKDGSFPIKRKREKMITRRKETAGMSRTNQHMDYITSREMNAPNLWTKKDKIHSNVAKWYSILLSVFGRYSGCTEFHKHICQLFIENSCNRIMTETYRCTSY